MTLKLNIGLIINPIAGLGGRVALKGSDSSEVQELALQLGAVAESLKRTEQALQVLKGVKQSLHFYTVAGSMGADVLSKLGFSFEILHTPNDLGHTHIEDTVLSAQIIQQQNVDILLFSGGDGTARNILEAVGEQQLCLGIPTGCKIYSGVFTVTPEMAGELLVRLVSGELVEVYQAQVLDIDEISFRKGQINTRVFGEMLVPRNGGFVQAVKTSGQENESLVEQEIAAWVVENLEPEVLYIIGSGGTCKSIKDELGIDGTLLGFDVVFNGEMLKADATEFEILELMENYHSHAHKLIISIIGGQGIIFGRGNHQVCHQVIKQLGLKNLMTVSSKTKITALEGRPLGVDTGDQTLNQQLTGYINVITGYDDIIVYPIGTLQ